LEQKQQPNTIPATKEKPMFFVLSLMLVVGAGLMVLVVAATESIQRPIGAKGAPAEQV